MDIKIIHVYTTGFAIAGYPNVKVKCEIDNEKAFLFFRVNDEIIEDYEKVCNLVNKKLNVIGHEEIEWTKDPYQYFKELTVDNVE